MFKIELHEQNSQPVLSIKTKTTMEQLPKIIGENYKKIMDYLNELGEHPSDAPFTAYHNLDMQALDVEMGFPVSKQLPGRGEIISGEIPAGKIVSAMYMGPYSGIEKTYEGIFKWISEEDLKPTGVYFEYYMNSPDEVPENELLTKIVIPVK